MGTLTAGLAHNINNSLVAVNTFLKMIPQKREAVPMESGMETQMQDRDFWDRFYSVALGEIERIQEMVQHILHSVKLPEKETNHLLNLQETDINALLFETILLVENEAKNKGILIQKEYDKGLKKCFVDSAKIRQVFMNLMLNAIYATSEGTILVKTMSEGEDHLKVIIEDTGIGIPQENMCKLFSPFFSTKEAHGVGLGLTMSREFIEIHRGSIQISSEIGKGTTITLSLPIHPEKNERRYHTIDRRNQQGKP
jgi:signal transduction histidine kinase